MMNKQKLSFVLIVVLLCLLFLMLGIGYSKSYRPGYFPDELAHMGYVYDAIKGRGPNYDGGLIYSKDKFNYLNHPALYYTIVGMLAKLFNLKNDFADLSRHINMFFSVIIIAMTCHMLFRATASKLAVFIGAAFLLVIPMFVVLGSAVNNDQINILGCTFVIYGLQGLIDTDKRESSLTTSISLICLGGIIAALSKATGSLAILCMFFSVALFNSNKIRGIIKRITFNQWLLVAICITIVTVYFFYIYKVYGVFYPAPQSNPATWFFIEQPNSERMTILDFSYYFLRNNFLSLILPYGHIQFIDSGVRVVAIKVILTMLLFMVIYIFVMNFSSNKQIVLSFECSLVIGFIVFFVLYFIVIRQLHLNTGYIGATQARYFFGFLPVFSLVMARAISHLHNKVIKITIFATMLSGLFMSFYPALIKFTDSHLWKSKIIIEQPLYDTVYGFLTKDRTFEQKILAESNSINGVELMLATFARSNYGALTLELIDSSGKIIASDSIKMEQLEDNAYAWFDFHQAELKKNHEYRLRLKCRECTQDNAITWWALKQKYESSIFLFSKFGPISPDIYPDGEAYVDGEIVGGSFAFRLYFY